LFSPLIIFFAFSGILQTFDWHRSSKNGSYSAPAWIVRMASIHQNQRLGKGFGGPSSLPLKFLVGAMGIGLIVTSLLGIWMAFKYQRKQGVVWGLIVLGIVLPVILLFL
jgi:uncharacterized membrane protein HdeD (DUF308 family)